MWNEYGDTNLHIVFGDTNNDSWTSVNSTGWRTKFTPPLTYWLSIQSQLGADYDIFGDGYVPYNIIVGPGYQLYLTGAGFDETASRAEIDRAMLNTQFYPVNVIADKVYATDSDNVIDLSGLFFNGTGEEIVYSVDSNTNTSLLGTSVSGDQLTVSPGSILGDGEITIKAQAGTSIGYLTFAVNVYDPGLEASIDENFDTAWLPTGWTLKTAATGAGWVQSNYTSTSGSYSACHMYNTGVQNDWIVTPKFAVTDKTTITFTQKGLYTDYYSNHVIGYSLDMNKFTTLYNYFPITESWDQIYIDLSALAGKEIAIGFNYKGDDSDVWFIDDVKLWTPTGIEEVLVPLKSELFQNYPNPFNPSTALSFSLDSDRSVTLSVYNSKGETVAEVFKGKLSAGIHNFNFDAGKLNSGIYFYALEFDGKRISNKMLLLK